MDNNLRLNLIIVIHIVLILILVGLAIKIKLQEDNYSCEECYIFFEQQQGYSDMENKPIMRTEVFIMDLYNGYSKDPSECPVQWNPAQGYMFNLPLNKTKITFIDG